MPRSFYSSSCLVPLLVAAAWWFYLFSPWTAGLTNFWVTMTLATVSLVAMAMLLQPDSWAVLKRDMGWRQLLGGLLLAALLWCLFWVGDKVSSLLFGFARSQVDSIYGMKAGLPPWLIALLLLLVIGPAEEFFWRGYVQRSLALRWGADKGFLAATALYALIHLWSFNFMLIMSALVCGLLWGFLYRLQPKWLPALVVSHAVWDACVFVVFPI